MNIPHPEYPLRAQEREAIETARANHASAETIHAIRARYMKMRDEQFPEWAKDYDRAVEEWANLQGATKR